MILYMAVTADKYELPLYVSRNIDEIAEKFDIKPCSVRTAISSKKSGLATGRRFVKVEVEE